MRGAINMYDERVAAALITWDRSAAGMGTRGPGSRESSPALPFWSPVDTVCRLECKQRGHPSSRSFTPLFSTCKSACLAFIYTMPACLCEQHTRSCGHRPPSLCDPPLHPDTWTGNGVTQENNDTSR